MNRKGGEEIMFFTFLLIIIVLGSGVAASTLSFFGGGFEFRQTEALILAEKVEECFIKNKIDFFEYNFSDKLREKCNLNKEVIMKEHLILIKSKDGSKKFIIGVADYENQCFFVNVNKNKNFPRCVNGTWVKDGVEYDYIVGSNQKGKRFVQT